MEVSNGVGVTQFRFVISNISNVTLFQPSTIPKLSRYTRYAATVFLFQSGRVAK